MPEDTITISSIPRPPRPPSYPQVSHRLSTGYPQGYPQASVTGILKAVTGNT